MARRKVQPAVVHVQGEDEMHGQESSEVIEISKDEYQEAVRHALLEVGLTYPQLQAQGRTGRFSSLRARKLWLAIGEPRVAR